MHYNWPAPLPTASPLFRTPIPLLVVMHEIAMSLSFSPPARMSVCFPTSSFPISQLIAVVVVVNRDGMASKAAAVSGDLSPPLSLLVYSRLQWRSHYHAHDDDDAAVSEWAPPPLSFLVFDKLRRRRGGERTASFSARRGGPWVGNSSSRVGQDALSHGGALMLEMEA